MSGTSDESRKSALADLAEGDEIARGFMQAMFSAAAEALEPAARPPERCDAPTDPVDEGLPPKNWPAIRAVVLHRDGYRCYLCGDEASEVDHLWPKARGGSDRLSNLKASCRRCNAAKGDRLLIRHITSDRAQDAYRHYLAVAFQAVDEAARWLTVSDDLKGEPALTVEDLAEYLPDHGTPCSYSTVLQFVDHNARKWRGEQ